MGLTLARIIDDRGDGLDDNFGTLEIFLTLKVVPTLGVSTSLQVFQATMISRNIFYKL